MSFEDLPQTWNDQPLDDRGRIADVVDLFVGHADREGGCLCFLVLDDGLRLVQPCLVDGVAADADPGFAEHFLDSLLTMVAETGGALVFARGRSGSVLFTDADRRWHDAVHAACRAHDVRLAAAFLATPATVRAFPEPLGESVAS